MPKRVMLVFTMLLTLLAGSCSSNKTTGGNQGTGAPASATPSAGASPTDCPTENTTSFAKTRFVADLGGSIFLVNRYIIQPYRAGTFTKAPAGAPSRWSRQLQQPPRQ